MKVIADFGIGEIVWFVYEDKIRRGKIFRITMPKCVTVVMGEVSGTAYYSMHILNNDGSIWGISDLSEEQIFATREELIDSLATTQIGVFELCKMLGKLDLYYEVEERIKADDMTYCGIKIEIGKLLNKLKIV